MVAKGDRENNSELVFAAHSESGEIMSHGWWD